ncbi:MAG: M48 family metalloprotease [Saprospiraceae bacterium]|nr:M48 family metalloprotease [Saprospiraceae bacterium]MBP7699433.1 M48 family metalloprotease [Saprospiraceae bacterium]
MLKGLLQNPRLLIALGIAIFSVISYYGKQSVNPVTGEVQHIDISPEQEIALGLQSAPQMAAQHGGLHPDPKMQALVKNVGNKLWKNTEAVQSPYQFDFHLLADPEVVNAFALPGGQVFITYALLSRLENEDQLAGVLGHEIGHVIGRHSAEHIAQQGLTSGLLNAVVVGAGDVSTAQMAQTIGQLVNMKYGRADELESDRFGVKYMIETGYDPNQMIGVMRILEQSSGGSRVPEFQSTHPSPENRVEEIKRAIADFSGKQPK